MNAGKTSRAFTIFEMMVVIGLMGVVSLLGLRVFRAASQMQLESAERQSAAASFDKAVQQIRADAWAATKLDCPDPHTLRVTIGPTRTVTWHSSGNTLTRTVPDEHDQHWSRLGADVAFRVDGSVVSVSTAAGKSLPQDISLVSQRMLLERSEP